MAEGRIFHLTTAATWRAQAPGGTCDGPVAAEQFERHGFVHCCFREQLAEIATWWFDEDDDLLALELDPTHIGAEVRLEPSPSRWYPHVYGPLDGAAVVGVHAVPRLSDGSAELPPAIASPPPGFRLTGSMSASAGEVTVRWRPGHLDGDPEWVAAANEAVGERRLVPVIGGVMVPADLALAYPSFAVLADVADTVFDYAGDGFFLWPEQGQVRP